MKKIIGFATLCQRSLLVILCPSATLEEVISRAEKIMERSKVSFWFGPAVSYKDVLNNAVKCGWCQKDNEKYSLTKLGERTKNYFKKNILKLLNFKNEETLLNFIKNLV